MKWFNFLNKGRNKIKVDKRNKTLRRVSFFTALIFIASLLLFNILFDTLLGDRLRWDWSFGQMYTTGEVTQGMLDDLEQNIQITGLYEAGTDANLLRIERILEDYQSNARGLIENRYVDMDLDPTVSRDLDPTGIQVFEPGTYVIKNLDNGRFRIVTYQELFQIDLDTYYESGQVIITGMTAESAISGAIQYVTAEYTPTIYALLGHNEDELAAYTKLTSIMKDYNGVDLDTLNLAIDPVIPDNCELIIVMDPKEDLTPDEQALLMDYMEKGGDLMIVTEYNTSSFPRFNQILSEFNINITDNRLREDDKDYQYNQQPYMFYVESPAGRILTSGSGQILTLNPREIQVLSNEKDWIHLELLMYSSEGAVSEQNGDPENISAPAAQILAVSCENTGWTSSNVSDSSKVIVIGSNNMLADGILNYYNTHNDELFYYSVNWLTDVEETNLFISEKPLPSYLLQKGTQTSYIFAAATALVIIPGALLVVGLVVYRKRKNL